MFRVEILITCADAHAPLILFPIISVHQLAVAPLLLPGKTAMARWNKGDPVTSGLAKMLLVKRPIDVPLAPVTEFTKLIPCAFTSRILLLLTKALKVPLTPGKSPKPAQLLEQPDPVVPALPIWLPLIVPISRANALK